MMIQSDRLSDPNSPNFAKPRTGDQKVYFYFFERPERDNQEVLSHSSICLPLPYMEGIVLIRSIDLYYVRTPIEATKGTLKQP